jgi:hypothetical protein
VQSAAPDLPADLDPALRREPDVEDDGVVRVHGGLYDRILAVSCDVDRVAALAQTACEQVGEPGVVLHHQ